MTSFQGLATKTMYLLDKWSTVILFLYTVVPSSY